jgi:hypothetical protein
MLNEIEETRSLANPYCLSGAEMDQSMADFRQRMDDINKSIELLWAKLKAKGVKVP